MTDYTVALHCGNPAQGRVDAQTGVASGVVPDLVQDLARKLGVPFDITSPPNARAMIDALNSKNADIGFLAYDETRAREVDFGPAFAMMCAAVSCALIRPQTRWDRLSTPPVNPFRRRPRSINGQHSQFIQPAMQVKRNE